MEANELRIGNYICRQSEDDGEVVDTFEPEQIIGVGPAYYGEGYVAYFAVKEGQSHAENLRLFNPVKITPEWLIKLGFNITWSGQGDGTTLAIEGKAFNIHTHDASKGYVFAREYSRDGNTKWNHIGYPSTRLIYIHQLQNLYFALTGEELVLK